MNPYRISVIGSTQAMGLDEYLTLEGRAKHLGSITMSDGGWKTEIFSVDGAVLDWSGSWVWAWVSLIPPMVNTASGGGAEALEKGGEFWIAAWEGSASVGQGGRVSCRGKCHGRWGLLLVNMRYLTGHPVVVFGGDQLEKRTVPGDSVTTLVCCDHWALYISDNARVVVKIGRELVSLLLANDIIVV